MIRVTTKVLLLQGLMLLASATASAGPDQAAASADSRWGPDLVVTTNTANTAHSENQDKVVAFLQEGQYLQWPHDPYIRPTGDIYRTPEGTLIDGTTHHRVRIYYSPSVADWLERGRPAGEELPDRSMIVKEMYKTEAPFYPEEDPVIGWAAMVKKTGASHDGWFWVIYFKDQFRSMATMAEFSYSFCLTCHASTKGEATFASLANLRGENAPSTDGRSYIEVADPLFFSDSQQASGDPGAQPLEEIDPLFQQLYADPSIYPYTDVPHYRTDGVDQPFPGSDYDHVWNRVVPADRSYVTSDNCVGCHDATLLVDTQVPNMLVREGHHDDLTSERSERLLNLSVYGEWHASPMGMAGRDPIFFAQLESEVRTYPDQAATIQNTCLSCHGAMGQRQFQADNCKGPGQSGDAEGCDKYFLLDMVFQTGDEPEAKYGALARDGISCMICHQMDPKSIPGSNSGDFKRGQWDLIYGPTAPDADPGGPIRAYPMQQALGLTPKFDPYLKRSEMCGACHTIVLPVEKPGVGLYHGDHPVSADGTLLLGEAHEQDTYLEWLYSAYQDANPEIPVNRASAATCQDCHMDSSLQGNGRPIEAKVANVQDAAWPNPPAENLAAADKITVPDRGELARHTFFGMNLFVLDMYRQFGTSLFGLDSDSNPPMGTVDSYDFGAENGAWQIRNRTAKVEILDVKRAGDYLEARVRVANEAGHRLPSGVGFRRAWLELRVEDGQGRLLWASGRSNPQGVIVGADGSPLESEFTGDWKRLQPHWQVITGQDQAQIYEERYVNKYGGQLRLTTSFLGIGEVVKSNRLQPRGYASALLREKLASAEGPQEREKYQSLLPESKLPAQEGSIDPADDEDYRNGSGADEVLYRIPLAEVKGAATVKVQLNYQNIPPYYLRDRFSIGRGEQSQRLYYLAGHLDVDGSPIDGWKIEVAEARSPAPQR